MSSSIFNENIQNRVINPRSGSSMFVDLSSNQTIHGIKTFDDDIYLNSNLISTGNISTTGTISGTFINNQFVDLSNNQTISGIKRFLNNLITNSNVNFNTTANIGRIVFKSNEPAGFGGNLVAIYTTDENDGSGWIFDSNGFLYYLGTGFVSQKIVFDPTGLINAVGAITGGSLSAGTGTISTTGNISGGSLFVGSGAITGGVGNFTSVNANSGTISTTGAISGSTISGTTSVSTPSILTNTISPTTGDILNFVSFFSINFLQNATVNRIRFFPTRTSGDIFTIFRVSDTTLNNGNWFYSTLGTFGYYASTVDGIKWEILSDGSAKFSGGVLTNSITPYSGTTINIGITSNFNFLKSSGVNRIKMFPSSISGDIVLIARVGDTSLTSGYHYFNNTGNFGYNTAGATVWELLNNGDITTTTQVKTNTITPNSGTTININPTSNFNFLKSSGVNRIKMFPSSISGDVMLIARSGDNDLNFGYWYFNNIGEFGFSFNGSVVWRIFVTGNMTTTNTIQAPIFSALNSFTHTNRIQMENTFFNASIASIDMRAQYIGFAHPLNALSALSKYAAIVTFAAGDVALAINNISGFVWGSDWVNRLLYSDYTFQSLKAGFTAGYRYNKFMNNTSEIGSISMLTASTVAFNQSSDYRLKTDIIPIQNPLERLMKLQPKNYRFIADVEDESCCECYFDGFLAHEVSDIIPMAVTGVKDDPDNFQQLDYSKFTPLLTGAVQELNEKVEKQQILIDKQQILIDSLISRLDKYFMDVRQNTAN